MKSEKEGAAADAPRDSLAEDVSSLRQDMAKMHDILSRNSRPRQADRRHGPCATSVRP